MLFKYNLRINFAHRTFQWNNEAKGNAAVHCVIIGYSHVESPEKFLYEYEHIRGDAHAIRAKNINPYLVDAANILLESKSKPVLSVPRMTLGSMPKDGGNLLLTPEEKVDLLKKEPMAAKWIRRFMGAEEFLNNKERWCLWLVDISPNELRELPLVSERVKGVRDMRLASPAPSTRSAAATPTLFKQLNQPQTSYLIVPRVSSERRLYIPVGYMNPEVIVSDLVYSVPNCGLYNFGVITSIMHNAWVRVVCGRLKSDYRYSNSIVYNNFPWPENPTEKQTQTIEIAAQTVLDARAQFPDSSLADLYDPLTMPPVLLKAHQTLDKAVDAAYGKTNFKTESERVAFLFELYQKYTSLLPAEKPKKARAKKEVGV